MDTYGSTRIKGEVLCATATFFAKEGPITMAEEALREANGLNLAEVPPPYRKHLVNFLKPIRHAVEKALREKPHLG